MLVDVILAVVFLASAAIFWYRVSLKIPELVAIPDQVITERLEEDSARLRLFLLKIKIYYREGKHKQVFWTFLAKLFYRIHLFLLRLDNGIVVWLKEIRTYGGVVNGNGNGNYEMNDKDYWEKLKRRQETTATTSPSKSRIIEEVRKKE